MIVGARFTWGHIPKTGGDAMRAMVQRLGIAVEMTPAATREKHSAFGTHLDPGGARLYATTIRRLPSWMLSVMNHRRAFGWFPPHERPHAATIYEALHGPMGGWADDRLAMLTNDGKVRIDRFLRMESLVDDLVAFMNEVEPVAVTTGLVVPSVKLDNFPRVNGMDYEHDFTQWFTPAEIYELYQRNPTWAEIEARVYEYEGVPA